MYHKLWLLVISTVNQTFMCGNLRLCVHLAELFNLFLKHGYLPRDFMQCTIVKNKADNLTDV